MSTVIKKCNRCVNFFYDAYCAFIEGNVYLYPEKTLLMFFLARRRSCPGLGPGSFVIFKTDVLNKEKPRLEIGSL